MSNASVFAIWEVGTKKTHRLANVGFLIGDMVSGAGVYQYCHLKLVLGNLNVCSQCSNVLIKCLVVLLTRNVRQKETCILGLRLVVCVYRIMLLSRG